MSISLDIFFIFIYIIIFLSAFFFEKKLLKYIEKELKDRRSSLLLLFSIISGSIFLTGWILNNFIKTETLKHIFKNFILFSVSIYILRPLFTLFIKSIFVHYLVYFLLIFTFLISVARESIKYLWEYDKYLLMLEKFLIVSIVYILFSKFLNFIKFKHIAKFLKLTLVSTVISFLLIWEFELITFSFETLIGFIILLAITGVYYYVITVLIPKLEDFISKISTTNDILSVIFNMNILSTSLYILFVKETLGYFLNLNLVFNYLSKIYILKNELVSISLYSILKVIITGVILFSLLNIIKKIIKFIFIKDKKYIEGGSAEALIFNIGILVNIMILLSVLGITWKIILPIAGTLGIGIGFGLQTIMNNYISGFILMFSRKLKVGDIVELPSLSVSTLGNTSSSIFGKIENIGILSTIVKTNDGVDISIPNSEFLSSPIINFSYTDPLVRLRIPIGVAYSSDPNTVKKILLVVAEEIQKDINTDYKNLPKTQIWFREMADSSLVFITAIWINIRENFNLTSVISNFYYTAWYKLKDAGIEIPFPQNDVWFRNNLKVIIEKPNLEDYSKV